MEGVDLPAAPRRRLRQTVRVHNVTEINQRLEEMRHLGDGEALRDAIERLDLTPRFEAREATVDV